MHLRARGVHAIAVADGAGSAARAEVGATVAVRTLRKFFKRRFHRLRRMPEENLAHAIVAPVITALRARARREGGRLGDYATTLLFAATDGEILLCGQLGDGRIALRRRNGELSALFAPVKGEHLNETEFVTQTDPAKRMQCWRADLTKVLLTDVVLMSDGAEESLWQRREERFSPALASLLYWLATTRDAEAVRGLRGNLYDVLATKTQDDLSIAWLRL